MIGMDFVSFVILLAISVVVSAVLHYGLKYYVTPGYAALCGKIIIGWLGAWLGSPVLGHWFEGLNYGQVYYIPAILGSLALLVLAVDLLKSCGSVCAPASAESEAPRAEAPEAG